MTARSGWSFDRLISHRGKVVYLLVLYSRSNRRPSVRTAMVIMSMIWLWIPDIIAVVIAILIIGAVIADFVGGWLLAIGVRVGLAYGLRPGLLESHVT
jgi:hypothetical protein